MTNNIVVQAIKSLVLDWIWEIAYFPIWWYTSGLKNTFLFAWEKIRNSNRNLALGLMIKHLFSPMYGQYDKQSRVISFFMRLILIFSRSIVFIFLLMFYTFILVFWICLPLVVAWGLVTNFVEIWKQ